MTKKKAVNEFNNLNRRPNWEEIEKIINLLYKDLEVVFCVEGSIFSYTCAVRDKKTLLRVYDHFYGTEIVSAKIYSIEYYELESFKYKDGYQLVITTNYYKE